MFRGLLLLLITSSVLLQAQTPERNLPKGYFHLDSVKIGQEIDFSFYYRHANTEEIIFPDSAFNFWPFELVQKRYFPTKTVNNKSLDSAVYTFRTFSVDPLQSLRLPVYILLGSDTIHIFSKPAKVYLKELVTGEPDPDLLQTKTELLPIAERFNFAYWFIGIGLFIITLVCIWLLFGEKIIIRYRLYILKNKHTLFINKYNGFIDKFNKSESLQIIEQAITLWKNYLTNLEGSAINSFTTREIATYYNEDEDVNTALRLFDKAIYGNIVSDKSSETIIAFYLLHHFADRRYEHIKQQTRHVSTTENVPYLA